MEEKRSSRIRDSPSVLMSCVLIVVYLITGIVGGNLLSLNYDLFYPLAQVNSAVWQGAVWMLFTSLFLHANPSHLGGNVLFLLIFGTSLEEQVSTKKWLVTYFVSGLAGKCCVPLPWRRRHRRWCIGGNIWTASRGGRLEGTRRYDLIHRIESFWGWRFSSPRRRNSRGFGNTSLLAKRDQVASNSRVHALHIYRENRTDQP